MKEQQKFSKNEEDLKKKLKSVELRNTLGQAKNKRNTSFQNSAFKKRKISIEKLEKNKIVVSNTVNTAQMNTPYLGSYKYIAEDSAESLN